MKPSFPCLPTIILPHLLLLLCLVLCARLCAADNLTAGIGRYPGSPAERLAPSLQTDTAYRNIALHRQVRASSAYDFNLTPQLLTDGIVTAESPCWLSVTTPDGPLPVREQEWTLDGTPYSANTVTGERTFLEYDWHGMTIRANRVRLTLNVAYDAERACEGYAFSLLGADNSAKTCPDGWRTLASEQGRALPGRLLRYRVHSDPNKVTREGTLPVRAVEVEMNFAQPTAFSRLRLQLTMPGAAFWTVRDMEFFTDSTAVTDVLPSFGFTSAWRSNGGGEQWACVDLGTTASFDRVRLSWVEKAVRGCIQTSADAQSWTTIASIPEDRKLVDDIAFPMTTGRYVRLLLQEPNAGGAYVLSEMEVFGRGGLVPRPHERAGTDGSRYVLNGGDWRLQRASEVTAGGEEISRAAFDTSGWIVATVPATVLTSYVNIGALPDPNYANNLADASESFFNADFWYRTTFNLPPAMRGKHVRLCLDGINWKASVYLNGHRIDRVEGAFLRSQTDVTSLLTDGENSLAIRIERTAHPGAVKEKNSESTGINGGMLGLDNPTFHATIGWDWITTVRGRDIGLWNDVFLAATDAVSLRDPLVQTRLALPDTLASVAPSVYVRNLEHRAVSGTLRGRLGDICFEQPVTLAAGEEREVCFSPDDYAQLRDRRLKLWWPNGYGTPFLYDASFCFVQDGQVSDSIGYKAGIRQMDYKDMDSRLTLYVNGRRLIPLGGNWGFSESHLNYRRREYETAVGLHREMNFNMIRNWVGQTADEEFYDACDEQGIMVWQDFWLANPSDGPDPSDEPMFLRNAADFTSRMRRHPCIAIYCGRNEGYPPKSLDDPLRTLVATVNPGLGYISSSADDGVSGHGPYWAMPAKDYFDRQTGRLHTERGMPNVMTYEGLCRTLPADSLWPQGDAYGQHDFTQGGAQRGRTFNEILTRAFGPIASAGRFALLAQWVNFEGYRAMFESGSRDRMGLLIWMSHACWPSLTWQCYDYYFEPTAAFFGCRKACEPIHIQWNALTQKVEVVNRSAGRKDRLRARRELTDLYGHVLTVMENRISCADDTTVVLRGMDLPTVQGADSAQIYVLRLSLSDEEGRVLSRNLYVLPTSEGNLQRLSTLPTVTLQARTKQEGGRIETVLKNVSDTPAMLVRLNLKAADGDQVLPVHYSDNFFHLLPGEEKTVVIAWRPEDARRQTVEVELSGMNVSKQMLR